MRFKRLDLNLLVALDILLTEKNVSRAAEKLFLSQSATSGALARLREYFNDELLVQVGRKMVLTPRAVALAGKVRAALVQIDGTIIQPPEFDPATVQRTVRLIASDFITIAVLRTAVRTIAAAAPGITLIIESPSEKPQAKIQRGEVDLVVMPEVFLAPEHPSEPFFTDGYVAVCWAGSTKFGETLSTQQFFDAQHATVMFQNRTPSYETWFMKNEGRERSIAAVAGSFSELPFLIEGTDFLAMMHRSLAEVFAKMMPLRIYRSPVEIPPLVECLQWHAYASADECLNWVRMHIRAAAPKYLPSQ